MIVRDAQGLNGKYKTQRFLEQIEKGNFSAAAKHVGFSGGKYGELNNRDLAEKEWAAGMEKLREEGIEIINLQKVEIITDDGFTSGYAIILVKYKDLVFGFKLIVSTNSGKVEPMYLTHQCGYEYIEPTEIQKMLTEKISEVICTYNPG